MAGVARAPHEPRAPLGAGTEAAAAEAWVWGPSRRYLWVVWIPGELMLMLINSLT